MGEEAAGDERVVGMGGVEPGFGVGSAEPLLGQPPPWPWLLPDREDPIAPGLRVGFDVQAGCGDALFGEERNEAGRGESWGTGGG